MAEGSGTRSSLLWEVKRLLDECEELPQVLLMENVPQVHSKANMPHFQKWLDYLSSRGYKSYYQDLNAKDFGVAQSRNRTFCVSVLGDYSYQFPTPVSLDKTMKDYLEEEVEDKYYLKSDKAKNLIDKLIEGGKILTDRQTDRQSTCHLAMQTQLKSQTQSFQGMTQEYATTSTSEVEYANGKVCNFGTTHYPHGWLEENASFNGISPTIDAGIWKHHTLLLEVNDEH